MALWQESPQKERPSTRAREDSLLAADLTMEGRIQGRGNVRIAAIFNGDIHVQGDLTIEPGGRITGELRADTIRVGGEVHGNVQATSRVELLESGTLIGDLKAPSLTVAAGSRMRGKAEFGWPEGHGENAGFVEEPETI